ncbi:MAG: phenylalanine--tRNA ligase subunit beta [Elusimicrobia bacterium]|nr:phenylalanine--tRNA ligase subunit beta [Elusimicrobiota bacterium]
MKVLFNWLNELVPLDLPPEKVAQTLTLCGLEVSQIESRGNDTILDLEVTPNRPDCMSHVGIARELASALRRPLRLPEIRLRELPGIETIQIGVKDLKGCPRYIGRVIREVTVAPSPPWLAQRLLYCGFRPINNVVDVTNYVLLEAGHPLHAFDLARFAGPELWVRRARKGETLKALDEQERTLDDQVLVIADGERPVALAGIVGGEESAVSEDTHDLLLESAIFDPILIRRTARRFGIRTESSYRFERGVGWQGTAWASQRAAALLQDLAGGKVSKARGVAPNPWSPVTIDLRIARVQQLLGVALDSAAVAENLRRLQFTIEPTKPAAMSQPATLRVTVPAHRVDVTQEVDVLEELARVYGYHEIPVRYPRFPALEVTIPPLWGIEQLCREVLIGLGHQEAVTNSFLNQAQARPFLPVGAAGAVPLNPLSEEWAALRPSLLPGLLSCVTTNLRRQVPSVRLCEVGRVFWREGNRNHDTNGGLGVGGGLKEGRRVAWVLAGDETPHWMAPPRPINFYALTGMVSHLFTALGISGHEWNATLAPWLHPGQSADVTLNGEVIGAVGQLHPGLTSLWESPVPLWLAELDLEALGRSVSLRQLKPPPRFPSVLRDLAIVLDEAIPYGQVQQVLHTVEGNLLEKTVLFDVYRGPQVPKEKKSLTLSLTFRHSERTLTDREIEQLLQHLREALQKQLGALPR